MNKKNTHSLDACRETDDREEESVCVEIFKHALDGLSVDPEGYAGGSEVQAAAHHVLWGQNVLVHGRNRPRDTTWSGHTHKLLCEIRPSELCWHKSHLYLPHTHTHCRIHTFAHRDTHSGQGDRPCRALVLSRHNLAVTQGYRSSFNALVTPETGLSHPPDQRWSPSKPYE